MELTKEIAPSKFLEDPWVLIVMVLDDKSMGKYVCIDST